MENLGCVSMQIVYFIGLLILASKSLPAVATEITFLSCPYFCGDGVDECIPAGDRDIHCKECNFSHTAPMYILDVDGDGWGECTQCTVCSDDQWMESPCSGFADGRCQPCTQCGEDEWMQTPCSDQSDGSCQACSTCLGGDEEVLEKCTETTDTLCKDPCRQCEEGEVMLRECDIAAGRPRECRACSDFCGDGVDECFMITRAMGWWMTDVIHCQECNDIKNRQTFLDDSDSDGLGQCKLCSVCGRGQFQESPCSDHQDTVCKVCTVCLDSQTMVEACSTTSDAVCRDIPSLRDAHIKMEEVMHEAMDNHSIKKKKRRKAKKMLDSIMYSLKN